VVARRFVDGVVSVDGRVVALAVLRLVRCDFGNRLVSWSSRWTKPTLGWVDGSWVVSALSWREEVLRDSPLSSLEAPWVCLSTRTRTLWCSCAAGTSVPQCSVCRPHPTTPHQPPHPPPSSQLSCQRASPRGRASRRPWSSGWWEAGPFRRDGSYQTGQEGSRSSPVVCTRESWGNNGRTSPDVLVDFAGRSGPRTRGGALRTLSTNGLGFGQASTKSTSSAPWRSVRGLHLCLSPCLPCCVCLKQGVW
jgi:hypothetical protein